MPESERAGGAPHLAVSFFQATLPSSHESARAPASSRPPNRTRTPRADVPLYVIAAYPRAEGLPCEVTLAVMFVQFPLKFQVSSKYVTPFQPPNRTRDESL